MRPHCERNKRLQTLFFNFCYVLRFSGIFHFHFHVLYSYGYEYAYIVHRSPDSSILTKIPLFSMPGSEGDNVMIPCEAQIRPEVYQNYEKIV